MLLKKIDIHKLGVLLGPHMGKSLWPGLEGPRASSPAIDYSKRSGLWDQLTPTLDSKAPLLALRRSDFLRYERTGDRATYEKLYNNRLALTHQSALGLWLGHPSASVDGLSDLLWLWCESNWNHTANEQWNIELVNSETALMLAEYRWLFREELDDRLRRRIDDELDRRMLSVALDWRKHDWWNTTDNNWNSVCNGNLIQIGLYQIPEKFDCASFIHPLIRRMDYAINYFPSDGGCPEGIGYWEYGFGHFIDAALAIFQRTGGALNLADDPHIAEICRFPMATHLRGRLRATFADAGHGYLDGSIALKINRLRRAQELFGLVERNQQGEPILNALRAIGLYADSGSQAIAPVVADREDYFLPDLGYAKLHGGGTVLAAVAGRNDVAHNHNDIGSFMLLVDGVLVLTDPGAPIYSSKTFSAERYSMLMIRSRGHSVPIVNGHEQSHGSAFFGAITVEGLNAASGKAIRVDCTHAYGDATLKQLLREIRLDERGSITLRDEFVFSQLPDHIEEQFITFEPPALSVELDAVTINTPGGRFVWEANQQGRFAVEQFSPAEHEGQDQRTLYRITFAPAALAASMALKFTGHFHEVAERANWEVAVSEHKI